MSFGLYKPGQGYWVRVLTAAFVGVWFLAGAAWAFKELSTFPIPNKQWNIAVERATGTATPGMVVEFYASPEGEAQTGRKLGTAEVISESTTPGAGSVVAVRKVDFVSHRDPTGAAQMKSPDASFQAQIKTASPVPVVEPLYVQTSGVALILLLGTLCTYWLVGASPKTGEFLIATDGEMKKVNWSTRKDIVGSTWVVIFWTFLLAGTLFVVDLGFKQIFQWLGVLKTGA